MHLDVFVGGQLWVSVLYKTISIRDIHMAVDLSIPSLVHGELQRLIFKSTE